MMSCYQDEFLKEAGERESRAKNWHLKHSVGRRNDLRLHLNKPKPQSLPKAVGRITRLFRAFLQDPASDLECQVPKPQFCEGNPHGHHSEHPMTNTVTTSRVK